jgi:GSH-dependent disulfide-bond oxidoreductase
MTAKILSSKSGNGNGNGVLNGASYNDPRKFLQTHEYKNLTRWTKEIGERPAIKRGRMVNRTNGPPPEEQLHERHDASDFETKTGQDRRAPATSS